MTASTLRFIQCRRGMAALLTAAMLIIAVPRQADAQVTPIAIVGTLAEGLNILDAHINAAINNARNAGDQLALSLGQQIADQIANARIQFHNELETDIQQLQGPIKNFLDNLNLSVVDFENKAYSDAASLLSQAQTFANTIPFHNADPQIASIDTNLLVKPNRPDAASLLLPVKVHGNFLDAGNPAYQPYLTFGTSTNVKSQLVTEKISPGVTNQLLTFNIPVTNLPFDDHQIRTLDAVIHVPFHHCYFLFVFNCNHEQDFPQKFWLLPATPGTITYTISTPYMRFEEISRSKAFHLDASHGDDFNHPLSESALTNQNYEIVRGSEWYDGSKSGDSSIGNDCTTDTSACWSVSVTQHHWPWCCDGSVDITLHWLEFRQVPDSAVTTRTEQILWGNFTIVPIDPKATFTAVIHRFDGVDEPIAGPIHEELIHVDDPGSQIIASGYPFGAYLPSSGRSRLAHDVNASLDKMYNLDLDATFGQLNNPFVLEAVAACISGPCQAAPTPRPVATTTPPPPQPVTANAFGP